MTPAGLDPSVASRHEGNGAALAARIEQVDPDLILVDYFDTLVTRTISADEVKRVTARHLHDRFALSSPDELYHLRRRAEEAVCARLVEGGDDPEHRLVEVAEEVWSQLEPDRRRAGDITGQEFVAATLAIEAAVEALVQRVDTEIVDVLRRSNRPVVIVSDFHAPHDRFSAMVRRQCLDTLVADLDRDLFVSCDHRRSKATGRLYPVVLDRLRATGRLSAPDRALMVGDNERSDGESARHHGLATFHVERPASPAGPLARVRRRTGRAQARSDGRRARAERHRAIAAALATDPDAPFGELALTLYEFTARLHRLAVDEGLDPLLFLAREGKFLHRLFLAYQELSPAAAGSTVTSDYLVVSRRSTVLAGLAPLDEEDFSSVLAKYPGIDLDALIISLGFDPDLAERVRADLGPDLDGEARLDRLRAHPEFRQRYEERRLDQLRLLEAYVGEVSGGDEVPLHLVDVGWKGTMQDHLEAVFGTRRRVVGLYLGVVAPGSDPTGFGPTKRALLFDNRLPVTPAFRILRHFKSLYEFLLQADHGSAASYRQGQGGADGSGTVEPVLDDQATEAELFATLIGPLQDRVFALFCQLCCLDGQRRRPLVADLDDVAHVHRRMLFFPRRDEIELIRSLRHYENFGSMAFVEAGGPTELSRTERLRALGGALVKPRQVLGAGWPPLALASVGLGRLVPVLGWYRVIREGPIAGLRRLVGRRS